MLFVRRIDIRQRDAVGGRRLNFWLFAGVWLRTIPAASRASGQP